MVGAQHDDFCSAGQLREPRRPIGEFGVANDHAWIDVAQLRLDLAVGVGRIEWSNLCTRGHAGIEPDHHLQAVAHQIGDALAGDIVIGQRFRQRRHRFGVLTICQFAVETGDGRRVRTTLGSVGERVDDGREIRVARIALRWWRARHAKY